MHNNFKYKFITLFSVIAIFVIFLAGCNYLNVVLDHQKKDMTPQELYTRAWNIINTEYFDSDFNGEEWKYWEHRYDGVLKTHEDAYVAIDTMLESLNDRYTRLLTPDKFKEQDTDIEAKISGIGIQIAEKDDAIIIVSVLEKTPAEKSQLKSKDKIIEVDGTSTKGLDLKDVAKLIRGKIGTSVHLKVLRGKNKLGIDVIRDEIRIKAVEQEQLENNISYIRLNSFISQNAAIEMEDAVLNARKADAIILDIRNNYGGLLPNAVSISNIFVDKGSIIVSIIDRKGKKKDIHAIAKALTDQPLIILINGASASASEILSGALKDHHRAILIGEKTFGKGMVQKIFDLPDGSGINVTVSKYLTPTGKDINKKGIQPDIEIELTLEDLKNGVDVQLEEAKKVAIQAIEAKKNLALK
jgi:carboxyl-terminal processing protease